MRKVARHGSTYIYHSEHIREGIVYYYKKQGTGYIGYFGVFIFASKWRSQIHKANDERHDLKIKLQDILNKIFIFKVRSFRKRTLDVRCFVEFWKTHSYIYLCVQVSRIYLNNLICVQRSERPKFEIISYEKYKPYTGT